MTRESTTLKAWQTNTKEPKADLQDYINMISDQFPITTGTIENRLSLVKLALVLKSLNDKIDAK